MTTNFQSCSDFLHFPRFPLAVKGKWRKHSSTNELHPPSLRTSHKKSEKGIASFVPTSALRSLTSCVAGIQPSHAPHGDRHNGKIKSCVAGIQPSHAPDRGSPFPARFPRFPTSRREAPRELLNHFLRRNLRRFSSQNFPQKSKKGSAGPLPRRSRSRL